MPPLQWIEAQRELSAAALTVQAQAVDPTDTGRLFWSQFMPRQNVSDTEIRKLLLEQEKRYVSDRRQWDARGRMIPIDGPGTELIEIQPLESYFKIKEKEINDLTIRFSGNEALMQRAIGPTIPARTLRLVRANYRRIEKDVFDAWSKGTITIRNPQMGNLAQTFSYGHAAGRHATAATAWNDPGLNAFDQFLSWIDAAEGLINGPVNGVILRRATYNAIQADASAAISASGFPMIRLTRDQFEQRVAAERGRGDFLFMLHEETLLPFTDGGIDTTQTDVWPAMTIGAIPAAGNIGVTAFAPVARAFELDRNVPDAGIDLNGMTVYREVENGGRGLTVECQVNAMPMPDESQVATINVGV